MMLYEDLSTIAQVLAKLLKPGARNVIPQDLIIEASTQIRSLVERLRPYFPPTCAEKREAKNHPIVAQITRLTTSDSQRKKFFSLDYFQQLLESLPEKKGLVAGGIPRTLAGARDAVILYHYRANRTGDELALGRLLARLEDDYRNSDQVKEHNRRRELYRAMMCLPAPEDAATRLLHEFPAEKDLKEFAKAVRVKIPAQSRRIGAQKKSVHLRLAEAIHQRGSIARLDLE